MKGKQEDSHAPGRCQVHIAIAGNFGHGPPHHTMKVRHSLVPWRSALDRAVQSIRFDPYLLLLFALSLLALTPLWAPGYFYEAHDGRHSVFYLVMFDASFRDGAWWPRWAMHHNQGYGYPTFLIQAPLGFYLAEAFILLGAGYTLAAKLSWIVGFLAGAWGMYALVVHWLRPTSNAVTARPERLDCIRLAGVAAGLLYVYFPYHLVDIYVRAALNDSLLLGWFPWVVLAFDRLIEQGTAPGWGRRLATAALALAGTLLTHTFALISFAPLLVTFVLFRLGIAWRASSKHERGMLARTLLAGSAGVAALLLCATFLIPLLVEGQWLQQQVFVGNTYDFRRHFVQWGQYLSPAWGFGYSDDPVGANDGMSFQVGLMAVICGATGVSLLWQPVRQRAMLAYLLVATGLLLWLMSPSAAPLWEAAPPLAVIQFPWRLLALTALTLCAAGGLVLGNLAATPGGSAAALLLISVLAVSGSAPYIGAPLQPVEPWREDGRAVAEFEREHPDMFGYTAWVQEPFTDSPLTDDYLREDYSEVAGATGVFERLAIINGAGEIISSYSRGSSFGGLVRMREAGVVRIHVYYFPGWQATVDGVPVMPEVSGPQGLVQVDVPAGEHRIDLRMGSTPPRRTGALISWATLLLLVGLAVGPPRQWRSPHRGP
jgi:hypothetical protein